MNKTILVRNGTIDNNQDLLLNGNTTPKQSQLMTQLFKIPEKIRFLLVGGYNTCFSYSLYVLFLYYLNNPQLSLFLSFILSSGNSFFMQRFFVFQGKGKKLYEYIKCLAVWSINYILNIMLLSLLLTIFNPYLAQFCAVIILATTSYLMLKKFAFRNKR